MFRRLIVLTLALTILFGVLAVFSTFIGRSTNPSVVLALSAPRRGRSAPDTVKSVIVWDLDRSLRADSPVPLRHILQMTMNYTRPKNVHIITYEADTGASSYKAGLYQYHYVGGRLITITEIESDRTINMEGASSIFFPFPSQAEYKSGFVHPLDKKPYMFDMATGQTRLIADRQVGLGNNVTSIRWSPDGTRVAVKDGTTLLVVNTDGSQQLEYETGISDFSPVWSEDSQYIVIQRRPTASMGVNHPIEIIHAADGTEHPLTKDLTGDLHTWWGCEGQWMTYTVSKAGLLEGYLLNMRNGQTTRLNDDPLLADKSIIYISLIEDTACDKFFVTLQPDNVSALYTPGQTPERSVYFYDGSSGTVYYIAELIYAEVTANTLYCITVDEAGKHHVFSRTLEPVSDPVLIGTYPAPNSPWIDWSHDMSAGVFPEYSSNDTLTGRLYRLDPRTGRTYALTTDGEFVENFTVFRWRDIHD